MEYFENNHEVTFDKIMKNDRYREAIEKENIDFNNLINALKNRNHPTLKSILDERINKKIEIMEPILYSVKKEYGSYEIYQYYSASLQQDSKLVAKIIREDPESFENTLASRDSKFVLEVAAIEPKVVTVMSDSLKSDVKFVENLCDLNNKEVNKYVANECSMPDMIINNPNLAENLTFMLEVVRQEPTRIEYASDELKNNYEFIKETCKENKEVINYVAEHTEEFGNEGLTAAKEELVENSTCRAIEEMKVDLEKAEIEKEILEKQDGFDEKSEEYKQIKIKIRQLNNNINFIERIKNGEVKQERAIRLINALCENLGEDYREEFLKYIKMDDVIIERENKDIDNEKVEEVNKEEHSVTITSLEEIDEITSEASLEAVKEEISITKKRVLEERSNTKETGEKENGSNDERA